MTSERAFEATRAVLMAVLVVASTVIAGVGVFGGTASAHVDNGDIEVTVDDATIAGNDETTYTIEVTNTGNNEKTFTIEATDVPDGWSVSDDDFDLDNYKQVTLDTWESESVEFTANPDGDSETKSVTFGLWHQTKEDCGFLCTDTDPKGHWIESGSDSVTVDGDAPDIHNVRVDIHGREATIKADVTDASSLSKVDVTFNPSGAFNAETIEMDHRGGETYSASKTFDWGTSFEYDVYAEDSFGQSAETGDYSDQIPANSAPTIDDVRARIDGREVTVLAEVTDEHGVSTVDVTINPPGFGDSYTLSMSNSGGDTYSATTTLDWDTSFEYDIYAEDTYGESTETDDYDDETPPVDPPTIDRVDVSVDGRRVVVTTGVSAGSGAVESVVVNWDSGSSLNPFSGNSEEIGTGEGTHRATIPISGTFDWGTDVEVGIEVTGEFGETVKSDTNAVSIPANQPPTIRNVRTRIDGRTVTVKADVTDEHELRTVDVTINPPGFGDSYTVEMSNSGGNTYSATTTIDWDTSFEYDVYAEDEYGKSAETSDYSDRTPPAEKPTIESFDTTVDGRRIVVDTEVSAGSGSVASIVVNWDSGSDLNPFSGQSVQVGSSADDYRITIPRDGRFDWGTDVEVGIESTDEFGHTVQSETITRTTKSNPPPSVSDVTVTANGNRTITVRAEVTDDTNGVRKVEVIWDTGLGDFFGTTKRMEHVGGNTYERTIPIDGTFAWGEDVQVKVRAHDDTGKTTTSEMETIRVASGLVAIAENASGSTVPDATIALYDGSYARLGEQSTGESGRTSWGGLESGQYHIELYSPNGSFWGAKQIEIDPGRTRVTIQRTAPRVERVSVSDDEANDDVLHIDDEVSVTASVANGGAEWPVRLRFRLDTDGDDHPDVNVTRGDTRTTISSGGSREYTYTFAPTRVGPKGVNVVVEAYVNDAWQQTGETGWTTAFEISPNTSKDVAFKSDLGVTGGLIETEVSKNKAFEGFVATDLGTVPDSPVGEVFKEELSKSDRWHSGETDVLMFSKVDNFNIFLTEREVVSHRVGAVKYQGEVETGSRDQVTVTVKPDFYIGSGVYNVDLGYGGDQCLSSKVVAHLRLVDRETGAVVENTTRRVVASKYPKNCDPKLTISRLAEKGAVTGGKQILKRVGKRIGLKGPWSKPVFEIADYYLADKDDVMERQFTSEMTVSTGVDAGTEYKWQLILTSETMAKTSTRFGGEQGGSVVGINGHVDDVEITGRTAHLGVEIIDTNQPVEGNNLDISVRIENTGGVETTQTITASAGGLGSASTTVTLEGGESTTETFVIPTEENDAGTYDVSVESANDSVTESVSILEPGAVTVAITETTRPVAGERLEVTTEITNTGDVQADQIMQVSADGLGEVEKSSSLKAGESTTKTFAIETSDGDAGSYTVRAESDDASDSTAVTVLEPGELAITITDTSQPAVGDPLEATVRIENVGGVEVTRSLTVSVEGLGSNSTSVTVDADESLVRTLTVETTQGDSGSYTLRAETESDADNTPVEILKPDGIRVDSSRSATVAGSPITLRANLSDVASARSYEWTVQSAPSGDADKRARPRSPTQRITSFRPRSPGEYVLELTVTTESGDTPTATTTITVADRSDLIATYAPIVHFDEDETFFPTRYGAYFDNARLSGDTGPITRPTVWDLSTASQDASLSLIGSQDQYETYDDEYPRTIHASVHPNVTYHGKQYTAVTYWLFYVYDPKGSSVANAIAAHPSDTETITVLLRDGEPRWFGASQHYGGERREWTKVTTRGTHPIIYPAEGAHSNYLRNASAYSKGEGFLSQEQFVLEGSDSTSVTVPGSIYADDTGGGPIWSPNGSIGADYQLVPLTGTERWQAYEGTFTPDKGKAPKYRMRWARPGTWLASIPSDEAQIDGDIAELSVDPSGDVTVRLENNGPKPHRFALSLRAKPVNETWESAPVRTTRYDSIPIGTSAMDTIRTALLPETRSGEWDVRATLRAYPVDIAEREDVLAERFVSTADGEKVVGWSAKPTEGNRINVTATISDAFGEIRSVVAIWDTGVTDIFGSEADMHRIGDRRYTTLVPPNEAFEDGQEIQVKVRVTDTDGNTETTDIRTVSTSETSPSIDDFEVENPSERTIEVRFEASERLADVAVDVERGSTSVGVLTEEDFTESGSGPYTYRATYPVEESGTYGVKLRAATGADGNEVTDSHSETVTVDAQSSENIALESKGATATASTAGRYNGDHAVASKAIDGDDSTEWGGTRGGGDWLRIELDRAYEIRRIGVDLGFHTLTYDVQISTDGKNWQTVADDIRTKGDHHVNAESKTIHNVSLDGRQAKYVNLSVESSSAPGNHIWQALIEEVAVFAGDGPSTGNEAPDARLSANVTELTPGEVVTLNASGSHDPDNASDDLTYEWSRASGPGNATATLPRGSAGAVELGAAGTYEFAVTVSDGIASDTATVEITVRDADPDPLTAPFRTAFEGGLSGWHVNQRYRTTDAFVDEWGPSTAGDGGHSTRYGGSVRLHVDGAPSNIGVARSVSNLEAGMEVTVDYRTTAGSPQPGKVAVAVYAPDGDDEHETFVATNSGDVEPGNHTISGTLSRSYPTGSQLRVLADVWPGEFTVHVKSVSVTRPVETPPPENVAPNASFEYAPASPKPNASVTFDAGNASDPDGSIAHYEWDFDGDGTVDATGVEVNRSFGVAGEHAVTLTVIDGDGASDSITRPVAISAPGGNATLTGDVTPGAPGENTTVTFTIENNRSSAAGFILDVPGLPANVSVVNHSDDGATWKNADTKWLYQTIDAGSSKSPSLTLEMPEDANGTYTVSAEVLDADTVVDSVTIEFTTCQSVEDALDENGDGEIGDFEILQAIEYWRTDEKVPGTCGKTIGDFAILELIELWRTGAQL